MELARADRRPAPRSLLIAAAVTSAVAGVCIAWIDQPVARFIAQYEPSAAWGWILDKLEWLILLPVHSLAVSVALVAAMLVTAGVRRYRGQAPAWMFLAGTHLVSRIAMNYGKDLTGRLRPTEWLKHGGDGTFWRGGASFPSGHVVLFAGIIVPLVVLFPRARPALVIVAFVMLARVAVNAHFVSDVIAGLALVALLTWLVAYAVRPLSRSSS